MLCFQPLGTDRFESVPEQIVGVLHIAPSTPEMIGAKPAISVEDRELFKQAMLDIGLDVARLIQSIAWRRHSPTSMIWVIFRLFYVRPTLLVEPAVELPTTGRNSIR